MSYGAEDGYRARSQGVNGWRSNSEEKVSPLHGDCGKRTKKEHHKMARLHGGRENEEWCTKEAFVTIAQGIHSAGRIQKRHSYENEPSSRTSYL